MPMPFSSVVSSVAAASRAAATALNGISPPASGKALTSLAALALAAASLSACGTQWSVIDVDGDGFSPAQG